MYLDFYINARAEQLFRSLNFSLSDVPVAVAAVVVCLSLLVFKSTATRIKGDVKERDEWTRKFPKTEELESQNNVSLFKLSGSVGRTGRYRALGGNVRTALIYLSLFN